MRRKEDFKKAADDYVEGEPDGAQKIVGQVGFEFGAEYGYQYAVDKACEWLYDKLYTRVNGAEHYVASKEKITQSEFVEQIRKSLDE